jgi:hypothetical protein
MEKFVAGIRDEHPGSATLKKCKEERENFAKWETQ